MAVAAAVAGRAVAGRVVAVAIGVVREVGGVKVVVREVGGMVAGRARSKPGRVAEAGVAAVALVVGMQVGMCHLLVPLPALHLAVAVFARPAATSSTATAPVGRSAASRTSVGYGWRC